MKNYIISSGFYVDPETGFCSDELVLDNYKGGKSKDEIFHSDGKKTYFSDPLLNKLNLCHTRDNYNFRISTSINKFLHHLNLSSELKKSIRKQVIDSCPKTSFDALHTICKTILNQNLPITTSELYTIIDKNSVSNKKLKKLIGTPKRDYKWYINRILSTFKFLTPEQYQKVFKKVCENYTKLGKILSLYSTSFLSSLTYFSMRALFPTKKFEFSDFSTSEPSVIYHRRRLKEIGIKYPGQRKKQ